MAAEISQIVIKIGAKELAMSLAEARELRDILSDALGEREPRVVYERVVERPRLWWPSWQYTASDTQYFITSNANTSVQLSD